MIPSIPVKLIIYTFLIGLLLAAVWKYGADRQEQGYETAKAEYLESERKARAAHEAELAKEADKTISEIKKRKSAERRVQELLEQKPRVKVHEIIKETECG